MSANTEAWASVRQALQAAIGELPAWVRQSSPSSAVPEGPLGGTLAEFREFLAHDEYELAWDALAAVGEGVGAGPGFWGKLKDAATHMGLHEKASHAGARE